MTDQHPITPPPELVQEWLAEIWHEGTPVRVAASDLHIATQAAQWGADQELEALCELLIADNWFALDGKCITDLRATRRPKPKSLKEQAKFAAAVLRSSDETCSIAELQRHWHTICNALEQLND